MPNKSSKAGHKPERTCIICRTKREKSELLSFYLLDGEPIFDLKNKVPKRKNYICFDEECLGKLDKWLHAKRKKERGLKSERKETRTISNTANAD